MWGKGAALCALFLAGCQVVAPPQQAKDTSRTFTSVVVDAGHGGRDSGAYRRYGPPEKVVTLDVATRLSRKLRESQFNVVMTRTSDVFIPLDTRVDIENGTPNSIFVSIHFNDSRRRGVKGFETYYHSPYAAELAQNIQSRLCSLKGAVNRGVHTADFRVVRKAVYPAVLVECGYLSNRSEGREARDGNYRDLLADKIAQAIVEQRHGVGCLSGFRARSRKSGTATATATTTSRRNSGNLPLPRPARVRGWRRPLWAGTAPRGSPPKSWRGFGWELPNRAAPRALSS